jgi:hypothetical protein
MTIPAATFRDLPLVNTTGSGIISLIGNTSTRDWVFTSPPCTAPLTFWLPASLAPKYHPKTAHLPPFLYFNFKMRKSMIALEKIYFYRKFASKAEIGGLLCIGGRAKERRWNVYECASL